MKSENTTRECLDNYKYELAQLEHERQCLNSSIAMYENKITTLEWVLEEIKDKEDVQ